MNSFKELENNQVKLFAEARSKRVYEKVNGNLGGLRFLGHIIEMYIPVMADTVVNLTAGENTSISDDEDPDIDMDGILEDLPDDDTPPSGPIAGETPLIR